MKTEPSESFTNYATRLRKAASKCNFTNWSAEKMIKSLIISNMHDDTIRLKFLQKDRTLDQMLDIARKKDAVASSKVMDGDSRPVVNRVVDKRNYPSQRTGPPDQCNWGGHEKHFPVSECPAATRICNCCKKKGHYASKCFKKQKEAGVRRIEEEPQANTENDSNTDEYDVARIELVNNLGMREKPSLMRVLTNDQEVLWQPDTGTQKNVWDKAHFRSFEKKTRKTVKSILTAGDRTIDTEICVTSEPSAYPLLSEQSAKQLELVQYNESFLVKQVSEPGKKVPATARCQKIADMIVDNPEVFMGKIGKAKMNKVSLMIDDNVTPVVQKLRQIPFNLLDQAENKIHDLLDQDIIEQVPDNQPRSWVSPPVIPMISVFALICAWRTQLYNAHTPRYQQWRTCKQIPRSRTLHQIGPQGSIPPVCSRRTVT